MQSHSSKCLGPYKLRTNKFCEAAKRVEDVENFWDCFGVRKCFLIQFAKASQRESKAPYLLHLLCK